MSIYFYATILLWLLGAMGMAIELGDGSMTRGEKLQLALLSLGWPLVMLWALVQWARGK